MSISKSYSAQLSGLNTEIITVEVDISNGLHSFSIIGLGDRAIEEAKERISAAIKNSGFVSPKQKNQKVTISLAPADLKKEGPSFDLSMAVTYLLASSEIKFNPENKIFLGELSLEGNIKRIKGILPILSKLNQLGFKEIFIPLENNQEASLAKDLDIYPVSNLKEIIEHLNGNHVLQKIQPAKFIESKYLEEKDMSFIKGNDVAKRGLEIAAAGAHNVALFGPPGTGKTLLAQCFPSILPNLTYEESVEVTGIHSISNYLNNNFIIRPPFRAPHHTASYPSIVGGGNFPRPGEITLAHRGVLFMDEFLEFDSSVIEALRQPLEEQQITISRAKGIITFPAQCILIASMNPCLCGQDKEHGCKCSIKTTEKYLRKISGPISDRIDIWINVDKIDYKKLGDQNYLEEKSITKRFRIEKAREIQKERFSKNNINSSYNSELNSSNLEKIISIDNKARSFLIDSCEKLGLSARAFHRIMKVSRTIADLNNQPTISIENILESLQYRTKKIN